MYTSQGKKKKREVVSSGVGRGGGGGGQRSCGRMGSIYLIVQRVPTLGR